MFEIIGTNSSIDDVDVYPLDGSGSLIDDWSLAIASGDYGPAAALFDVEQSANNNQPGGLAFTLDDFTSASGGVLTGVAGLRFVDHGSGTNWDPVAVGSFALIPEPSTLLTGLLLLGVLGPRRRRKR